MPKYSVSLRSAVLVALCEIAAGCASPHSHDLIRPEITAVAADEIAGGHNIFIATTRAEAKDKAQVFDGQRSARLHLARITVSVPAIHKTGEIERPKGRTARPDKFFTASDLVSYSSDTAFEQALRADIASHNHRALVFIHGYNNLFDDAVYRMTQIVHDTGYAGTPVLFSWARAAAPSTMSTTATARPRHATAWKQRSDCWSRPARNASISSRIRWAICSPSKPCGNWPLPATAISTAASAT